MSVFSNALAAFSFPLSCLRDCLVGCLFVFRAFLKELTTRPVRGPLGLSERGGSALVGVRCRPYTGGRCVEYSDTGVIRDAKRAGFVWEVCPDLTPPRVHLSGVHGTFLFLRKRGCVGERVGEATGTLSSELSFLRRRHYVQRISRGVERAVCDLSMLCVYHHF